MNEGNCPLHGTEYLRGCSRCKELEQESVRVASIFPGGYYDPQI